MYEPLKDEDLIRKVGGRFQLSSLLQKRLVQLNAGSQPLVDSTSGDPMDIALQEIRDGKIFLDLDGSVKPREAGPSPADLGFDIGPRDL